MAGVPFGSLIPQRSRVLPQGGAVLGQLTGTFQAGLEQGRMRAAEEQAPDLLLNYLESQGQGYRQPTLGNLAAPATGYVGGQQAPRDPAMTPGSPTFNGGTAMRQARQDADAGIPQPPPVSADYAASIAGYGSGLNTTGLDAQFGTGLNSAIQAYIAAGGNPADVQINSLVRSTEEQQRLYEQYQRGEIGLAAPPGQSRHEYGAAADIQSGPFLDWLHQNAGQYGLSFLTGNAFTNDPGHVQLAGPSPAGTRAPAIPAAAGGMPSTGGYSSQPAWSPPTGAERAQLRALMINPATRQMGYQLAIQRMTPPAPVAPPEPVVINGQLVDRMTGQVIGDYRDPQAAGTDREMREDANGILRYVDTQEPVFPAVQPTPEPAEPPETRNILMPDGNVYIMGFNPATGQFDQQIGLADPGGAFSLSVGADGAIQVQQGRGTSTSLATEGQANANVYAGRMEQANTILNEVELQGTDLGQQIIAGIPVVGNFLTSPEYQQYQQAQRNFVTAVLRRESGAVITDEEFATAARYYFPQPGDSPQVIEQKRQTRQLAIDLIRQASGPYATQGAQPATAPAADPAPAAPGIAPVQVRTPADWEALPTGTRYIDPEGVERIKQ